MQLKEKYAWNEEGTKGLTWMETSTKGACMHALINECVVAAPQSAQRISSDKSSYVEVALATIKHVWLCHGLHVSMQ